MATGNILESSNSLWRIMPYGHFLSIKNVLKYFHDAQPARSYYLTRWQTTK